MVDIILNKCVKPFSLLHALKAYIVHGLREGTKCKAPSYLSRVLYLGSVVKLIASAPSTGKDTQSSFWQETIAVKGVYIWLAVASFVALIAFILLIVICCTDSQLKKTVQIERRYGMFD
jgi:hypothetical protein